LQNPSKDFVPAQPLRYGTSMTTRPAKHSLTLHGHRTSVSLEPEFWDAFRTIAIERGTPLNQLAAEIDARRPTDVGLASAIRVFVLQHHRGK
jgi:predicted DNA-binding ribbon-helix-helix protein